VSKTIPLEELRSRAVRDPALLIPGTLVIIAHVPDLEKGGYGAAPSAHFATIRELRTHKVSDGIGGLREELKIHYFDKNGEHESFAGDRGVIRYPIGHFNEANFIVIVSELVNEGVEIDLNVSEEYKKRRWQDAYGDSYDPDDDVDWGYD
jgi:hypothetical protein